MTNFVIILFSLLIQMHDKMHELLHEFSKLKIMVKQQTLLFSLSRKGLTNYDIALVVIWFSISSYFLVWLSFLYFSKRKCWKCYEKCFMFHLNCSFGSWDTQIFLIFLRFVLYVKISKRSWKWKKYVDMKWFVIISNCNFWNNS